MKQIIVHSEAELELWQAVDYYEARCAGLGLDFEHEVSRAVFFSFSSALRVPDLTDCR